MVKPKSAALLVGLIMALHLFVPSAQGVLEEEIIVLFDEAHGQPLSYSSGNFTEAIDALNGSTAKYSEGHYARFVVRLLTNSTELNATTLSAVDILMLGNPGVNGSFLERELLSMEAFAAGGGSLLLMGDYQLAEEQRGNPALLNSVLVKLGITEVAFWEDDGVGDVIEDPTNHVSSPHWVYVNDTKFTPTPIAQNVSRVLITSSSLRVETTSHIVATSDSDSYAKLADGSYSHLPGGLPSPPWLVAVTAEETKILLCGSTTMFSDLQVSALGSSWHNAEDNSRLLLNMLAWLVPPRRAVNIIPQATILITPILLLGIAIYTYYSKKR